MILIRGCWHPSASPGIESLGYSLSHTTGRFPGPRSRSQIVSVPVNTRVDGAQAASTV